MNCFQSKTVLPTALDQFFVSIDPTMVPRVEALCWSEEHGCGIFLTPQHIVLFSTSDLAEVERLLLEQLFGSQPTMGSKFCCRTPAGFAIVADKSVACLDHQLGVLWTTTLATNEPEDEFNALLFHSASGLLLLAGDDGCLTGISIDNGQQQLHITGAHESICMAISISQLYPAQVYSGGLDGYLRRWSIPSATKAFRLEKLSVGKKLNQLSDPTRSINPPLIYTLAMSHREEIELLAVGVGTGDVMLYKTTHDRATLKGPWIVPAAHRAMVTAVCFVQVATGWLLLTAGNDRQLKLVRVQPTATPVAVPTTKGAKRKGKGGKAAHAILAKSEPKLTVSCQLLNDMTTTDKVDVMVTLLDNQVAIVDAAQTLHLKTLRAILTKPQLEVPASSSDPDPGVSSAVPEA